MTSSISSAPVKMILWLSFRLVHRRRYVTLLLTALLYSLQSESVACCDKNAFDELGKTTAEIVKLRGFKAEDHEVTTTDGYILNLVKATNPLINGGKGGADGKPPVLFMHGYSNNANIWIVNSVDAEPKDHSKQEVDKMCEEDLKKLAAGDKAFNSVAFTFLNFGHEVWLLNRRGTQQSQKHKDKSIEPKGAGGGLLKGLTGGAKALAVLATDPSKLGEELKKIEESNSKKYWDFSFDEEAKYDWPETIDYVLKESKASKLVLVGHSAGGALSISSQVEKPELADKRRYQMSQINFLHNYPNPVSY